MAKMYRKKPEYIEAAQYMGSNVEEIEKFISSHNGRIFWGNDHTELYIFLSYGTESRRVWPTDYITFSYRRGFSVLSYGLFDRMYENAD